MKYITYERDERRSIGVYIDGRIFDIPGGARAFGNTSMVNTMLDFLNDFQRNHEFVTEMLAEITPTKRPELYFPSGQATLLAPLPNPRSFRDFYAFEEHVKTARAKRDLEMIPEWYEFPVFYFSNHQAIFGTDSTIPYPNDTEALDYELEIAAIIGKKGKNIPANRADQYIAGYSILNDWSARDIQRKEMKVGLGPAKGKDFATSLGPYLVSTDELEDSRDGDNYNLLMSATISGQTYSQSNWNTLYYSFGQMIERASKDCTLYPGDVIGSGTVGTGCILELGPEEYGWLLPGSVVSLEIEKLGQLTNKVGDKNR